MGNCSSRADPARGSRKPPPVRANPRTDRGGKPCSCGESPPIPAKPGCTMTGLSRRRSRVRVPSLPLFEVPANKRVSLSDRMRQVASWPNPVAQTIYGKGLQSGQFWKNLVPLHEVHAIDGTFRRPNVRARSNAVGPQVAADSDQIRRSRIRTLVSECSRLASSCWIW
jgi:hypothetical protein